METGMQKMMNGLVQCRVKPLRPRKGKVCFCDLIYRYNNLLNRLLELHNANHANKTATGLYMFWVCFFSVLEFERVYLDNLPSAAMYERSYMHRDVITHIVCTK